MAKRAGRLFKTLLILVIIGGVVYAIYWRVQSEKKQEEAKGGGSAQAATSAQKGEAVEGLFRGQDAIPVKVSPVVHGTLVQTVHAQGTAQPRRQVKVTAQVNGPAKNLLVHEGDYVRVGQVLLEIDDAEYQLDLKAQQASLTRAMADYAANQEQASTVAANGLSLPPIEANQAALRKAEANLEQAKADLAAGRITQDEYNEFDLAHQMARILAGEERGNVQKAQLIQQQVAVSRAERNLERTKVRAPFAGWVANVRVDQGQNVGGGTEICTLLDLNTVRVDVDVLESEIAPIRAGRLAKVDFTALPDETFEAKVVSVNPMIDPDTRTGKVTLEIANPKGKITSGMFARARIFARFYEDVNMVPLDAIVERDEERTLVFQVEPSTDSDKPDVVKWRYVQLGPRNDTHVIVEPTDNPHEGVAEGMMVCVEGHVSLQHDSYVKVIETIPSDVLVP